MLAKVAQIIGPLCLGTSLLTAFAPAEVAAGAVTTQFSIRLIVSPPCDGGATPTVRDVRDAQHLAERYIGLPASLLDVDHDTSDTGYWIVSVKGETLVRISKCTGVVSKPLGASSNFGQVSEPTTPRAQR